MPGFSFSEVRNPLDRELRGRIDPTSNPCPRDCWSAIRQAVSAWDEALLVVGLAVFKGALQALPAAGKVGKLLSDLLAVGIEVASGDSLPTAIAETIAGRVLGGLVPAAAAEIASTKLVEAIEEAVANKVLEIVNLDGHVVPSDRALRKRHCYAKVTVFYNRETGALALVGRCVPGELNAKPCCDGTFVLTCTVGRESHQFRRFSMRVYDDVKPKPAPPKPKPRPELRPKPAPKSRSARESEAETMPEVEPKPEPEVEPEPKPEPEPRRGPARPKPKPRSRGDDS